MLEEINRVPSEPVSVLYPLRSRKNKRHEWATAGPSCYDEPGYDELSRHSLDDAMLDRFVSIWVDADLEDYLAYSQETGPDEDVLAFLRACPDMLLVTKKAADSTALYKSPTPRGWTKVQELRRSCAVGERLMRELIAGVVGPQAAAAFYGFLQDRGPAVPAARTVLECYEDARDGVRALVRQQRNGTPCLGLCARQPAVFGPGRPDKERGGVAADLPVNERVVLQTLSARSEELTACCEERSLCLRRRILADARVSRHDSTGRCDRAAA